MSWVGLLPIVLALAVTPASALRFLGESDTYARFPIWNPCQNASISFEFQTRQPTALLLYTDDNGRYDYLQLLLYKGAVRLLINFVANENQNVDIEAKTLPLNDGQWHRVEIRRNRMETTLLVDGTQTSKVALGSDSDPGLDPAQNNYVYFGGIPSSYYYKLRDQALPQSSSENFRGDIRNILYFNCSCIPVRASMVEGRGVSRDPPEACDLRNPCPADCPCVSVDDGSGCECSFKRECLKGESLPYFCFVLF
jgi:leucine-rich repeat transmembrane neuronal protein 1/2